MCLLFIASNPTAALLAPILITNSVLHLRGLSTWSSCLSLWLCCKAKGKPWGMVRPLICVHHTVSAWARTSPINISLSSYLIETSPVLNHQAQNGLPCFVMLFPSLSSMNMNGLHTPELHKLFLYFAGCKKFALAAAKKKQLNTLKVGSMQKERKLMQSMQS